MKLKRALKAVRAFLDADERERLRQRSAIKKVLRKLKGRERSLAEEAESAGSAGKARSIRQKRRVVRAQRKKGVEALRELR